MTKACPPHLVPQKRMKLQTIIDLEKDKGVQEVPLEILGTSNRRKIRLYDLEKFTTMSMSQIKIQ